MAREDGLEFEEVSLFGCGKLVVLEDTCSSVSCRIAALEW
jgi:hypothetical protein